MTRAERFGFFRRHPNITTLLVLLILLILVRIFLFTTPTPLDSLGDFESLLANGQPTVLSFYSNL